MEVGHDVEWSLCVAVEGDAPITHNPSVLRVHAVHVVRKTAAFSRLSGFKTAGEEQKKRGATRRAFTEEDWAKEKDILERNFNNFFRPRAPPRPAEGAPPLEPHGGPQAKEICACARWAS